MYLSIFYTWIRMGQCVILGVSGPRVGFIRKPTIHYMSKSKIILTQIPTDTKINMNRNSTEKNTRTRNKCNIHEKILKK